MKFAVLLLFIVTSVQGAPEAPIVRSRRIYADLVAAGVLKGRMLTWQDKTYDVSENWQICDAYVGICFKAHAPGENEPLMLAVFELPGGGHDILPIDYLKYRHDRGQDAIHWFIAHGATMQDVFKLNDGEGRPLFDVRGELTDAGDAAYETQLRGGASTVGPESKPAEAPKRKRCPHAAAVKQIRKLKLQLFVEIDLNEYDCLHSFFPKYDDEEMNVKTVCDESRDRYFYASSDSLDAFVVETWRKKGKCPDHGTKTFGKP